MLPVEWSNRALRDSALIQSYIEQRDPDAALRLRERIEAGVAKLPRMPNIFRHGRVSGTREYVAHPNYIVICRVEPRTIKVLRVLHARRQYP